MGSTGSGSLPLYLRGLSNGLYASGGFVPQAPPPPSRIYRFKRLEMLGSRT